jgi:hypothetical protein
MMMKEIALDWAVVIVSVGFGYGLRIPHPSPRASVFSSRRSFSGEGNKMHRSNKKDLHTPQDVR